MTAAPLDRALHAISDPTRRRILQALKPAAAPVVRRTPRTPHSLEKNPHIPPGKGPCLCAGDIEEKIRLSQPTISHHMAILTRAGLVDAVKQGQWRWYRRNEPALRQLIKALRTNI